MGLPVCKLTTERSAVPVEAVDLDRTGATDIRLKARHRQASLPVPHRCWIENRKLWIDPIHQSARSGWITHQEKPLKPAKLRRSNTVRTMVVKARLEQDQAFLEQSCIDIRQINRNRRLSQLWVTQGENFW